VPDGETLSRAERRRGSEHAPLGVVAAIRRIC